jgi:CubicO group peptidase (beta-lactamase class C family)
LLAVSLLTAPTQLTAQDLATTENLQDVNNSTHASTIVKLLETYHEYGQFNGTVLVADKGNVIVRQGFGLANMEWEIPNSPITKFRIGSVTKQFTAALILQLVEEGKVKLDQPITTYLPDYRKETGDKVTVHQLLTPPLSFSPSSAATPMN